MKKLFYALCFCFCFSSFTFGQYYQNQGFEISSDVSNYLQMRNFSNEKQDITVSFKYDGIYVNGRHSYFNVSYTPLSASKAYVRGESLTNPDGVIKFTVSRTTNCIIESGASYCSDYWFQMNKNKFGFIA